MSLNLIIEIFATGFSLTYLFLLVKENIWCWFFAIISAFLSIYLFINAKLYSEAFLYFSYVLFGIYGWYKWSQKVEGQPIAITKLPLKLHAFWVVVGGITAFLIGYLFQAFTDAEKTYVDAHTTSFSFVASYLEANKYLYAWVYWIIINGVSVWLYFTQGLSIYAGLMVVYFFVSGLGLWNWYQKFQVINAD
ncbi:MAG: nicotinamide riboside transporter PnuC [Bacteroidota bacterium]